MPEPFEDRRQPYAEQPHPALGPGAQSPPAQPPYGQPQAPYGGPGYGQPPYGQVPLAYGQVPLAQAPSGQPVHGDPAPYGYGPNGEQSYPPYTGPYAGMHAGMAYGQPFPHPVEMPQSVRAARTVIFILCGITVAVAVIAGAADHSARTAGFVIGASITNLVAFVLALRFEKGRRGVQIGAIVCASLGILIALSRAAQGQPQLLVGAVVQGVLISRLATAEAKAWFGRPRIP